MPPSRSKKPRKRRRKRKPKASEAPKKPKAGKLPAARTRPKVSVKFADAARVLEARPSRARRGFAELAQEEKELQFFEQREARLAKIAAERSAPGFRGIGAGPSLPINDISRGEVIPETPPESPEMGRAFPRAPPRGAGVSLNVQAMRDNAMANLRRQTSLVPASALASVAAPVISAARRGVSDGASEVAAKVVAAYNAQISEGATPAQAAVFAASTVPTQVKAVFNPRGGSGSSSAARDALQTFADDAFDGVMNYLVTARNTRGLFTEAAAGVRDLLQPGIAGVLAGVAQDATEPQDEEEQGGSGFAPLRGDHYIAREAAQALAAFDGKSRARQRFQAELARIDAQPPGILEVEGRLFDQRNLSLDPELVGDEQEAQLKAFSKQAQAEAVAAASAGGGQSGRGFNDFREHLQTFLRKPDEAPRAAPPGAATQMLMKRFGTQVGKGLKKRRRRKRR